VAAHINTDLIASGSNDGLIRLWKCSDTNAIIPLTVIPIIGFVNALAFTKSGKFLLALVSQEHKFGRWYRIKTKNCLCVIPLQFYTPEKLNGGVT